MNTSLNLDELLPFLHCFAVLDESNILEKCDTHFAALLDYSVEELIGSSYRYIVPLPESLAFSQLLQSEERHEGKTTLVSKDRNELSFKYNFSKFDSKKLLIIAPESGVALRSTKDNELYEFTKMVPMATALFGLDGELRIATGGWWRLFEVNQKDESLSFNDFFIGSQARWKRLISHTLSGRIEKCDEDHVQVSTGQKVWMGWTLTPWKEGNEVSGFVMSIDDIHERKIVEAEARAARVLADTAVEQKMSFMSRMSHEIRTPLNCLSAMTESLEDTPLNSEQEKYVSLFKSSLDHLLNLINDILDLRKIQESDKIFNLHYFSLGKILNETVEPFKSSAKSKNLELTWNYSGLPLLEVEGDSYRLKQIIINLVGNALKFTDSGKVSVELSAKQISNRCESELRVIDSGIGMTEEQQVRVFESFTQADSSITEKYGGTGLGLSIVKSLVDKMNGQIRVESQVGIGTSFIVTIPFARFQLSKPVRSNTQTLTTQSEQLDQKLLSPEHFPPARILIVDDSEMNRMAIVALLKSYPIEVREVPSAIEALSLLERENFDVVFMDIQMPGMNGYEAVDRIRHFKEPVKRNQWVVALTANAFKEDVQKSLDAGFNAHLSKPIKRRRILRSILQNIATDRQGKRING